MTCTTSLSRPRNNPVHSLVSILNDSGSNTFLSVESEEFQTIPLSIWYAEGLSWLELMVQWLYIHLYSLYRKSMSNHHQIFGDQIGTILAVRALRALFICKGSSILQFTKINPRRDIILLVSKSSASFRKFVFISIFQNLVNNQQWVSWSFFCVHISFWPFSEKKNHNWTTKYLNSWNNSNNRPT